MWQDVRARLEHREKGVARLLEEPALRAADGAELAAELGAADEPLLGQARQLEVEQRAR